MRILAVLIAVGSFFSTASANERFYIGGRLGVSDTDGSAKADLTTPPSVGQFPDGISIDELPFDTTETTWGGFVSWQIKDWVALELGYQDLGNAGTSTLSTDLGSGTVITNFVAMDIEEWYLGARFSQTLSPRFSANWIAGLSRVEFDVQGDLPLITDFNFFGAPRTVPFATPDDETGLTWGLGFGWSVNDRFRIDLDYKQHRTQVLTVDSLSLALVFAM